MLYLGINIGGTKCSTALGKSDSSNTLELIDTSVPRSTKQYEPYKMLDALCEDMQTMLLKNNISMQDIKSIGISCGGPLNSRTGVILSPPNLPGWDAIPVTDYIHTKLGIKAWLCNDANAGALAEWMYGAAQGKENIIFLTFGTGLGAGIISDGRLLRGASDMVGEVGHIRIESFGPVGYGKAGSLEGFCSGGGIAQLAKAMVLAKKQTASDAGMLGKLPPDELDAKAVAQAAARGDSLGLSIMEIVGTQLGKGLAILIDILNPECIVIGSIYTRCEQLLSPFVQKTIEQEALHLSHTICQVKPALLSESIGDMSALSAAVYFEQYAPF